MMQMQMNNMLNNQNTGNQNQNASQTQTTDSSKPTGGKCVIFRKSGEGQQGPPIMIQCMDNDKISDVIQRYRTKSSDNDNSKKFIFNAKQLNPGLSVVD